ncbi:MAG: TdeIII family type II restriction endonuclease [Dehalococcoidia bacterium]|nr:TdeIII family type II restriction endonuclease [Dehalococcoidia bacterium]
MRDTTRDTIRAILASFYAKNAPKMKRWTAENIRVSYPFHRLMFDDEAIVAARVERSIVTSMGSSLFRSLGAAVARDRYELVYTEHDIRGQLNDAACNMLEQIVTELRTPVRTRAYERAPDHQREMNEVLGSLGGGLSERIVRADLYIEDFDGGPLFIELKTPTPNLDMAAESKRKLLYYLAMQARSNALAQGFVGLTYNPFGTRDAYAHNFTKQLLDMERQVLIGPELWDMIGGEGAYTELIALVEEVAASMRA